jgi:Peptidase S24-like
MPNIVTERFVKCIDELKETSEVKSLRQFALAVDYHPQNLNEICKGKRDVTIDLIKNAIETFNFNPSYIFSGVGSKFMASESNQIDDNNEVVSLEKIVYVPMAAHAGYTEQFQDPVFLDDLISFSLPDYKFQHGTYRCFDIVGDSMEPSLYSGDKVVCSIVDMQNMGNFIRNQYVYVVVMQDAVVVKRVNSKPKSSNMIELISDNDYYPIVEVHLDEIKELWYVDVKISPFLPSPNNIRHAFHSEMDEMRKIVTVQSNSIHTLNQTVEKLLKQNRSTN